MCAPATAAIDTARYDRIRVVMPWIQPIVAATYDNVSNTAIIIGKNGTTWEYRAGDTTTTVYEHILPDTFTSAVAVARTYIVAAVGTEVVKYTWPDMKEASRIQMTDTVRGVQLWYRDRVVVATNDELSMFKVEDQTPQLTRLFQGSIVAYATYDSVLVVCNDEGVLLRVQDDGTVPIETISGTISHMTCSDRFVVVSRRDTNDLVVVSLTGNRTIEVRASRVGARMTTLDASTFGLLLDVKDNKQSFSILKLSWDVEPIAEIRDHGWSLGGPTKTMKIMTLSPELLLSADPDLGVTYLYHVRFNYHYPNPRESSWLRHISMSSDSTVNLTCYSAPRSLSMSDNTYFYHSSIVSFSVWDGIVTHRIKMPIPATKVTEIASTPTMHFVRDQARHWWSAGTLEQQSYVSPTVLIRNRNTIWRGLPLSNAHVQQMYLSRDGGISWSAPSMQYWPLYPPLNAYQIAENGRLVGPYIWWQHISIHESVGSSTWYTPALQMPRLDLKPVHTMPIADDKVMFILDEPAGESAPSHIWNADYTNNTIQESSLEVPGVGPARIVSTTRNGARMLGVWRDVTRRYWGIYGTDGTSWKFLIVDTTGKNTSNWSTLIAANDSMLIAYDHGPGWLLRFYVPFDRPVSVHDDADSESHGVAGDRVVTFNDEYEYRHGEPGATIVIHTIEGNVIEEIQADSGSTTIRLPQRGLYVVQVRTHNTHKSMLLLYSPDH